MSYTIHNQSTGATTATATSLTVTWSVAPTAGRTLIAIVSHSGDFPAAPSAWGTHIAQDVQNGVTRVFSKTSTSSEPNPVFTSPSAGGFAVRILEISGIGPLVDLAVTNTDTFGTGGGTFTTGSVTHAITDGLMIAALGIVDTPAPSGSASWTSPMTTAGTDVKTTHTGVGMAVLTVATNTLSAGGTLNPAGSIAGIGTTATSTGVTMTFAAGTTPLGVNAGADQSIYTTQTASLTATPSGGSGTKIYAWTKVNGPAGAFSTASAASTVFTPSGGVGTYTLRCIVTDSSGSSQDDVVITVTAVPSLVFFAEVVSSTGWTATGGTHLAVLSDASDSTLMTTTDNPTNVRFDAYLAPMTAPVTGQNVVLRLRGDRPGSSSGSVTCRLYEGPSLRSTVTMAIPASLADFDVVFPATDVAPPATTASSWSTIVAGSGSTSRTVMHIQIDATAAV